VQSAETYIPTIATVGDILTYLPLTGPWQRFKETSEKDICKIEHAASKNRYTLMPPEIEALAMAYSPFPPAT
jgi:hypothetical protein